MYRVCIYCGVAEVSRTTPCVGTVGHWFNNVPAIPTFANVIQCPVCQRGEPCRENLRLTAEAENALLKKKLEIALRGLDHYANNELWEQSLDGAFNIYIGSHDENPERIADGSDVAREALEGVTK